MSAVAARLFAAKNDGDAILDIQIMKLFRWSMPSDSLSFNLPVSGIPSATLLKDITHYAENNT